MPFASTSRFPRIDGRLGPPGLLALALLTGASAARAEIYKCIDLDGHVSYGSAPCETLDLLDRLIDDNGVYDAEPPPGAALPETAPPTRYAPPSAAPRQSDRRDRGRYDPSAAS